MPISFLFRICESVAYVAGSEASVHNNVCIRLVDWQAARVILICSFAVWKLKKKQINRKHILIDKKILFEYFL